MTWGRASDQKRSHFEPKTQSFPLNAYTHNANMSDNAVVLIQKRCHFHQTLTYTMPKVTKNAVILVQKRTHFGPKTQHKAKSDQKKSACTKKTVLCQKCCCCLLLPACWCLLHAAAACCLRAAACCCLLVAAAGCCLAVRCLGEGRWLLGPADTLCLPAQAMPLAGCLAKQASWAHLAGLSLAACRLGWLLDLASQLGLPVQLAPV